MLDVLDQFCVTHWALNCYVVDQPKVILLLLLSLELHRGAPGYRQYHADGWKRCVRVELVLWVRFIFGCCKLCC